MTKKHRYTSYHHKRFISDDLKVVLEWAGDQFGDCDTTSKSLIEAGKLNQSATGVWGAKLKMLGNRRGFDRRYYRRTRYDAVKIRWLFDNEDDLASFLFFSRITHINQGRQ